MTTSAPRLRLPFAALAFVLAVAALPLHADVTGAWSGKYQWSTTCAGQPVNTSGEMTLEVAQNGGALSGIVLFQTTLYSCQQVPSMTFALPFTATLSGSSIAGSVTVPTSDGISAASISGTVSGTSISLSITNGSDNITSTLQQTSTAPPAGAATGEYDGSYAVTQTFKGCPNVPKLSFSGALHLSLRQVGNFVTIGLTAADAKDVEPGANGNCTVVTGTHEGLIEGQLDGTAFHGTFLGETADGSVTGTIDGLNVTLAGGNDEIQLAAKASRLAPTTPPVVLSFQASPPVLMHGSTATLSWQTTGATGVVIDNGVGARPPAGQVTVQPGATTTYLLAASGPGGTASARVTVRVADPAPANVVVALYPHGMLERTGEDDAADRYVLRNIGGTATTMNLTQNGSFFTQQPTQFTLAPNDVQVITITPATTAAGKYEGVSVVSGSGIAVAVLAIPVKLIIANPPSNAIAVKSSDARVELVAPDGQNPTGSFSLTNPGATEVAGALVSDVPWINVPSALVTLAAGETKQIPFSVDRSRRRATVGGARGTLRFRFLNGVTSHSSGHAATQSTTVISDVSVSIVDVVTLGTTPGAPPPLANGEVAFFVPGASARPGTAGDVFLSNFAPASVSDMKLYFAPFGGASKVSSIGEFLSDSGISLPGIVKNIFGASGQAGTLQLRSAQLGQIAVSAAQTSSSLGSTYVTALPLLRSDRGAAPGQSIYLAGVKKSTAFRTNLELQEMNGSPASVQIDFLDANGTALSSRTTDTVTAFGALELLDVVPAGAAMLRVTNTSPSAARIGAYAIVTDTATNDSFTVADYGSSDSGSFFYPAPTATAATRDLYFTNSSASPISVSTTTVAGTGVRRRSTAASGSSTGFLSHRSATTGFTVESLIVPPFGLVHLTPGSSGFVRLDAPPGALHASGALSTASGIGTIGSGVPAVPASDAAGVGELRRFTGIEDSSDETIAAATPSTYRSNLILIETTGQPVTVRLTLRYVFDAGATVSASAVNSTEVNVPGGGNLEIDDLGNAVIGAGRADLGDLHDALLDVEVVTGLGRVLPFVQSVDNASGEVTVRLQ